MVRVQLVVLITSILVTGFIVEQVRRRCLAVEYSLIWIVAGLGMIFFSLWRNGIEYLADLMGIYYAPSAIFVVFGILVFVLCIHFSLTISKLSSNNRVLIQRMALIEDELSGGTQQRSATPDMNSILAIVPALNEVENIGSVVENLKSTAPWLDVLVIDDGSTDRTAEVARDHGAKVISLPVNLGIGGAVQTGFLYAVKNNYDVALQVDGDGQHRAEEIKKLIEPVLTGEADVTIGSRFLEKTSYRSAWPRRMGIYFLSKTIQSVVRKTYTDPTSGFRAYNQKALRVVSTHYSPDYPEPDSIVTLVKNRLRVIEISVEMDARLSGSSSITPFKSGYYMFKVSLAIILNSMMSRIWRD